MFGSWKQNRWSARNTTRRLGAGGNGHRSLLSDRTTLAKLAVGLLAAIATVFVIDFGGTPFSYRVGQIVSREIRAKTNFSRLDETRTAKRRDQAADAVPLIYRNDPSPIEQLQASTESLIDLIALADSLEQVPPATAAEWGLTPEAFTALQGALKQEDKHQVLARSVRSAFEPLLIHGLLDADAPELRSEPRLGPKIQVLSATGEATTWDLTDVNPAFLVDASGPFAQALARPLGAKELGDRIFTILRPRLEKLPRTLTFSQSASDMAKQAVKDAVPEEREIFEAGDRLVPQEQPISKEQLALLKIEHEAWISKFGHAARLWRTPSLAALVLGLYAMAGYYIVRFERSVASSVMRLVLLGTLIVATVGLAKRLHGDVPHGETIPVALVAMTLAIAFTQQFALLITFGLGLLCAWTFGTGVNDFVVLTGGTAAAVLALNRVRSRTKLIGVGATAGIAYFALTWATGLLAAQSPEVLLKDGALRLLWGVMSGFLMGGSLPFLEKIFGIVTDINLLELSDVSHPLLLDLMRKAPGTYNHSVTVATLAESAAEHIGANPLLARVGSYFHDVGKMLKPHYFIENQTDSVNRHEALNPAMSTLIIIGHVKDGADLAHQHHLPQLIIDLIEQHHGTTLVEYFYQEAAREVEESDENEADVQESSFRYPGPKPQTKEACVLMLADAVESASRTLSEPTPGRIEGLVDELTMKRLLDGQFDECGITLQEIAVIKESLVKSLNAIYHGRVKYPEPRLA